MIYILKKDFSTLKQFIPKIILFVYIPILLYYITITGNKEFIHNRLNNAFSLEIIINKITWIELILFLLHIFTYLYLSYYIFKKTAKNNIENIFLKIKYKKWLAYKSISIFLILFILTFIKFLIYSVLLGFKITIIPFISLYLYTLILVLIFITVTNILKSSFNIFYGLLTVFIIIFLFPTNVTTMNPLLLLTIIAVILLILNIKFSTYSFFEQQ